MEELTSSVPFKDATEAIDLYTALQNALDASFEN
jgi:hypothetical protein